MHRVARAVLHPLCLVGGLALALGGSVTPILASRQRTDRQVAALEADLATTRRDLLVARTA